MIFDGFDTLTRAADFAAAINAGYGLEVAILTDLNDSQTLDPFPFELTAPVVHVERSDGGTEERVQEAVTGYGGRFAGT